MEKDKIIEIIKYLKESGSKEKLHEAIGMVDMLRMLNVTTLKEHLKIRNEIVKELDKINSKRLILEGEILYNYTDNPSQPLQHIAVVVNDKIYDISSLVGSEKFILKESTWQHII